MSDMGSEADILAECVRARFILEADVSPSLPPQQPRMLPVPLRISPALLQRRVAVRTRPRRAALDESGERLGGRAGDVDALRAQVRDPPLPRSPVRERVRRGDRARPRIDRLRGD